MEIAGKARSDHSSCMQTKAWLGVDGGRLGLEGGAPSGILPSAEKAQSAGRALKKD